MCHLSLPTQKFLPPLLLATLIQLTSSILNTRWPRGKITYSLQELLANVARELEEGLQLMEDQGFGPLKKQYLQTWLHTGQRVSSLTIAWQSPASKYISLSTIGWHMGCGGVTPLCNSSGPLA